MTPSVQINADNTTILTQASGKKSLSTTDGKVSARTNCRPSQSQSMMHAPPYVVDFVAEIEDSEDERG